LTELRTALADLPVLGVSGQGGTNKFGIAGWDLSALQLFQFGDLRIELRETTLVVEAESAGGVGNLVKYWPLLRSDWVSTHAPPSFDPRIPGTPSSLLLGRDGQLIPTGLCATGTKDDQSTPRMPVISDQTLRLRRQTLVPLI
jgi:hypothetical protein